MNEENPFSGVKTYDSFARLFKLFILMSLAAAVASVIALRVGNKLLGMHLIESEVTSFLEGVAYSAFCLRALKGLGVDLGAAWRDWDRKIARDLLKALKYFGLYLLILAGMTVLAHAAAYVFSSDTAAVLRHAGASETRYDEMRSVMYAGTARFVLMLLTVCVLAPLGEELFFRRLLYAGLRKRLGFAASLVISSVVFSLAHFSASLLVLPVGLLLGFVYEKERRLPVNIILHGLVNFFVVIMRVAL